MAKMFKAVRISKSGGMTIHEFPEHIANNKKLMASGGWEIQGEIPETLEELKENTAEIKRKVEVEEITPTIKKITKSKTGK